MKTPLYHIVHNSTAGTGASRRPLFLFSFARLFIYLQLCTTLALHEGWTEYCQDTYPKGPTDGLCCICGANIKCLMFLSRQHTLLRNILCMNACGLFIYPRVLVGCTRLSWCDDVKVDMATLFICPLRFLCRINVDGFASKHH